MTLMVIGVALALLILGLQEQACVYEERDVNLNFVITTKSDNYVKKETKADDGNAKDTRSTVATPTPNIFVPFSVDQKPASEKKERNGYEKAYVWFSKFFCDAKITDFLVAIFTYFLFVVTYELARVTRQLYAAGEKQIAIAEKSANAALAALDRPWLVIESLHHNRNEWVAAKDRLTASFRIRNYGTSPAFIDVDHIEGLVFYSFKRHDDKETSTENAGGSLHFPSADKIGEFIASNKKGRSFIFGDAAQNSSINDVSEAANIMQKLLHNTEMVISPGDASDTIAFHGAGKLRLYADGLPIESQATVYMIGRFSYSMPGRPSEVMTFCYEDSGQGGFTKLFGPPYNERRQVEG